MHLFQGDDPRLSAGAAGPAPGGWANPPAGLRVNLDYFPLPTLHLERVGDERAALLVDPARVDGVVVFLCRCWSPVNVRSWTAEMRGFTPPSLDGPPARVEPADPVGRHRPVCGDGGEEGL